MTWERAGLFIMAWVLIITVILADRRLDDLESVDQQFLEWGRTDHETMQQMQRTIDMMLNTDEHIIGILEGLLIDHLPAATPVPSGDRS